MRSQRGSRRDNSGHEITPMAGISDSGLEEPEDFITLTFNWGNYYLEQTSDSIEAKIVQMEESLLWEIELH